MLALLQALLLVRTALDKSDTIDEPHYLATAVRQWSLGDTSTNCDAPALPKWGFAAALRLVDQELFRSDSSRGLDPLWSRRPEEMRRNLLAARLATIALTVVAGLFLWRAGLAFGPGVGSAAHVLWCLSPSVLAHGSLATLDGWVTSLLCVALWAMVRFVLAPRAAWALVVGACLALAAASKVTALGAVPVAVVVIGGAIWRSGDPRRRGGRLLGAGLALAIGFSLTLWAAYLFRIGTVDLLQPCGVREASGVASFGPVPAADWWAGLLQQWRHGQGGHLNYLFGEVSSQGWWWFYLAALGLKTTVGAQLLALLRLASWARRRPQRVEWLVDGALLAYPALLVLAMSLGNAQNGIRYILPVFPFAIVWVARGLLDTTRALGGAGRACFLLALLLGSAESLARHPHHLMFFNLWAGGPEGGPRYLVAGDDWGQDQRRLGAWQVESRPGRLYYTRYSGRPEYWNITYETPPCEPRPGYYALHAVEVHRPKRIRPGCLDWLTVGPPDERFGYSIYLYRVSKARIEWLLRERDTPHPFWRSGPEREAAPKALDQP